MDRKYVRELHSRKNDLLWPAVRAPGEPIAALGMSVQDAPGVLTEHLYLTYKFQSSHQQLLSQESPFLFTCIDGKFFDVAEDGRARHSVDQNQRIPGTAFTRLTS